MNLPFFLPFRLNFPQKLVNGFLQNKTKKINFLLQNINQSVVKESFQSYGNGIRITHPFKSVFMNWFILFIKTFVRKKLKMKKHKFWKKYKLIKNSNRKNLKKK